MLNDVSSPIPETLDADVVIVGSGIAGVVIARKLAERKIRTIVVESGSEPFLRRWHLAPATLKAARYNVNQDYIDLHVQRSFGGASNVWGGWCSSMRSINFSRNDIPNYPAWPISKNDLKPYYRAAGEVLALDTPDIILSDHANLDGISNFAVKVFRVSPPIRVPESWGKELKASPHIQVILGLTAETFDVEKGGITALRARRENGSLISLTARQFVFAGGACNNAMLLMRNAEKLAIPAESRAHIGVNFFEHPQIYSFGKTFLRPNVEDAIMKSDLWTKGSLALSPQDDYLLSKRLLDFYVSVAPIAESEWNDAQRKMAVNYKAVHGRQPKLFNLMLGMELAPDRANRLIADEKSPHYDGAGKLELDFGVKTIKLAKAARAWFETVAVESWFDDPRANDAIAVGHLMGMTPMATRAADGVIDPDCRVFGVRNLYVAGSSVFPTTGAASPTLTLTALSLRLAQHLVEQFS